MNDLKWREKQIWEFSGTILNILAPMVQQAGWAPVDAAAVLTTCMGRLAGRYGPTDISVSVAYDIAAPGLKALFIAACDSEREDNATVNPSEKPT